MCVGSVYLGSSASRVSQAEPREEESVAGQRGDDGVIIVATTEFSSGIEFSGTEPHSKAGMRCHLPLPNKQYPEPPTV